MIKYEGRRDAHGGLLAVLRGKLIKRGVSVKNLEIGDPSRYPEILRGEISSVALYSERRSRGLRVRTLN